MKKTKKENQTEKTILSKANANLPRRFQAKKGFTKTNLSDWNDYIKARTLTPTQDQEDMICNLYAVIFKRQYFRPIKGKKVIYHMIDKLDIVYKSYKKT